MVEWIVRRAQGDRARVGTLTGMVCILANVALCAAKGAIGVVSGSVSIVADAMNNLSNKFPLSAGHCNIEQSIGIVVILESEQWTGEACRPGTTPQHQC